MTKDTFSFLHSQPNGAFYLKINEDIAEKQFCTHG